ncbi:formamidopyrimidine-DNA glycosylase [Agromyces mangrovi Wang et al. 2018]|nr:formamidopyrimidine-DNA glycosylase [Agromyces mangrovi]
MTVGMPELPEVDALVGFLRGRTVGRSIRSALMTSFSALKTFDPPLTELVGRTVTGAARHGKWLDLDVDGVHLVAHLARAGWLRWYEQLPASRIRPGKSPIAMRVGFDDGSGFDLTEAGTKKSLAVYVVRDAAEVPGIASLGPEPLGDDFTLEVFAGILSGRRTQIKGVLREQSLIAGVGNAYSDEVLHVAKMSPYALAASLDDEEVARLYDALRDTLRGAVEAAEGRPAAELKDAKRQGMRVHARGGETCPVCGDTVRDVHFADRSMQYCPTCQTGGKLLADRRMSRLLK